VEGWVSRGFWCGLLAGRGCVLSLGVLDRFLEGVRRVTFILVAD
jgi:hypothetical protein